MEEPPDPAAAEEPAAEPPAAEVPVAVDFAWYLKVVADIYYSCMHILYSQLIHN